jgi:pimeloyl-ACP methyl ester carboxylesterase
VRAGGARMLRGLLAVALLSLGACNAADVAPRARKASVIAREAGWSERLLSAGAFDVMSFSSSSTAMRSDVLTIYIESDGLAFLDRVTVSNDPTPQDPLALRLAIAAPQRPVAYLARPCQYTMPDRGRNCTPAIWTGRRYAPEVVDSMDRAVDALKSTVGASRLVLVGYSGGGVIAALLAARRSDVAGIVTVAANLDLGYWVRRDGLAPLVGSLDPVSFADRLAAVPQVHFAGARDDVVGPDVVRAYLARLPKPNAAALVELSGYDHRCCWVENWPKLVVRPELAAIAGWR